MDPNPLSALLLPARLHRSHLLYCTKEKSALISEFAHHDEHEAPRAFASCLREQNLEPPD